MRNAGPQLRSWNAALIPLAGVLLGAIDPAIVCCVWRISPKQRTQHKAGQAHQNLTSGADAAMK